jgi:hypothetical protein
MVVAAGRPECSSVDLVCNSNLPSTVLGRLSEIANEGLAVGKDDLVDLWRLVEGRDGGPAWIKMMEKELPTFTYQAWRRDAQVDYLALAFICLM